jgi:UDP-N-acetylmuramyl tripeptide synthase
MPTEPAWEARAVVAWQQAVAAFRSALGWTERETSVAPCAGGVILALAAREDRLLAATELNECAVLAARLAAGQPVPRFLDPAGPPTDREAAVHQLRLLAAAEEEPALPALLEAARRHGVLTTWDEEAVTLGGGVHGHTWPRGALPAPGAVPWSTLASVPTALVTGSNGKTTTVRLLAAMGAAHGWRVGSSCTDGVTVGDVALEHGDWSGPAGARRVLRSDAEAAVLETARGGILRRGLAVAGAPVAVVTNIQLDHLGEYGIVDHAGLARTKLAVAKGLAEAGWLVLNGADPQLVAHAPPRHRVAWFALAADTPRLVEARRAGTPIATIEDGMLVLARGRERHALGEASALPLGAGGLATHNLENALAASLAGWMWGLPPATIAATLAWFGARHQDNPGRLAWHVHDGAQVVIDFAHNPDGLAALLRVAKARRAPGGRLLLLLGQAGNRDNEALAALAAVVAAADPARVMLKELEAYRRGRAIGEVPAVLAAALEALGYPRDRIATERDEETAALALLAEARPGDVVVLPVHQAAVRNRLTERLGNDR